MFLQNVFRFILFIAFLTTNATAQTPDASPASFEDPAHLKSLKAGIELTRQSKPQEAITNHFDPVIAHYETRFSQDEDSIYCSRSITESLAIVDKHIVEKRDKGARLLTYVWCYTYFQKAAALVELKQYAEALVYIQKAIALSPFNADFFSELGYIYERQKDWPKAMQAYKNAETATEKVPDDPSKDRQLARAKRGVAYVLIELNQLDEAKKIYQQVLAANPNDRIAREQSLYIQRLKIINERKRQKTDSESKD